MPLAGTEGPRRPCGRRYSIIVTAGANQALSSCMLTLVDPEDSVVLFKPYCAPLAPCPLAGSAG